MYKLKKLLVLIISVVLMTGVIGCSKSQAKIDFEQAAADLETKNKELETAVSELQKVLDSEDKPMDETLIESADNLIETANETEVSVPKIKSTDEEIEKQTKELKAVDYSSMVEELNTMKTNLETSIKNKKLLTNPTEEYILSHLTGIENVGALEAATEENDPNGQLHKDGGYTSAVFFESDLVPADTYFSDASSPLKKGTDGGGSIEVYATEEDAIKRNEYLAAFDGTVLSSGAHHVFGTIIVRISNEMTATNQQLLTDRIVEALTKE